MNNYGIKMFFFYLYNNIIFCILFLIYDIIEFILLK